MSGFDAAADFFGDQWGEPNFMSATYGDPGVVGLTNLTPRKPNQTIPASEYPGQYSFANSVTGMRKVPTSYARQLRDYPQDLKAQDARASEQSLSHPYTQSSPVGGNPMPQPQVEARNPNANVDVDGSISPRMAEAINSHGQGPTVYSDVGAATGTVNVTSGGSTTNRAMPTQPLMYSGGSGANGTASVSQSFKPAEQPMQSLQQQVDQFKSTPAPQSSYEQSLRSQNFATGGMVRGPGTGTSDSIPAKLSDGEFIIPADVVRYYGTDKLNKMVEKVGGMRQPIENKDGVMHASQQLDPTDVNNWGRGTMDTQSSVLKGEYDALQNKLDATKPPSSGMIQKPPSSGMIQDASNAMQAIGGAAGRGIAENYNTTGNQAMKNDTTFSDILNYKGAKANGGIPSFSSAPVPQPVASQVDVMNDPTNPLNWGRGEQPAQTNAFAQTSPVASDRSKPEETGVADQAMRDQIQTESQAPAKQAAPVVALPQAVAQQVMQQAPQQFQGGMRQPDYSDQINSLIAQAQEPDNSGGDIDAQFRAKGRRRRARELLGEVAGLQGKSTDVDIANARNAQDQYASQASAEADAAKANQQQLNWLANYDLDTQKATEAEAQNVANERRAVAGENRAVTAEGMTRRKQLFAEGQQATRDAATKDKLRREAADREGSAQSFLTEQGMVKQDDGTYRAPGSVWGTNPASKEQMAEFQRLQFGGNRPQPKRQD